MPNADHTRLVAIERHFHALVCSRAAQFGLEAPAQLPRLLDMQQQPAWYPVPGMYGGFSYRLEGEGEHLVLIADSWSRIVGGSGQTHRVDPSGYTLIDDGIC